MGSSYDWTGDSSQEPPSPETSTRRLREQTQRDFEIEFLGKVLERDPFFVDAIRVQANNLAATGRVCSRAPARPPPGPAGSRRCDRLVQSLLHLRRPRHDRSCLLRAGSGRSSWAIAYLHRLRKDPDLKTLRRDPRFLRLLRRFEFLV